MKALQKYANMAFLLLSVATMVPTYANPTINEQEQIEQEEITLKPQTTKRYDFSDQLWAVTTAVSIVLVIAIIEKMMAEHQLKKYGYVTMRGWEIINGKPIKTKSIKAC